MSNVDLSSLETKRKEDKIKYSDIEEEYGLDLFVKKQPIFPKYQSNKLFDGKSVNTDNQVNSLFKETRVVEADTASTKPVSSFDFSYVILGIALLCLVIYLVKGAFKNEHTY